MLDYNGLV